ncbi:hypothetical protein BHE74_00057974 [Ensete ventricosum]|nr:hypothetical protein BHE74_00057974 [Ensete ventricosum]
MQRFDPLPCRRGPHDTLKVHGGWGGGWRVGCEGVGGALCQDHGHGKASWPPIFFACQLQIEDFIRSILFYLELKVVASVILVMVSLLIWMGPWHRTGKQRTSLQPERTEWPRVGFHSLALLEAASARTGISRPSLEVGKP